MAHSGTGIRYLEIDPWVIEEKGFHPRRGRVSESIFALGNEFMGVRGNFEEGYSGDSLHGSYFNGIFEGRHVPENFFKGMPKWSNYIINAVNWLYTRVTLENETLDLATCRVSGFVRRLDLRTGVLRREFVWTTRTGKKLKLCFERFTSMQDVHLGGQRITVEALNFSGKLHLVLGLDFGIAQEDGSFMWPDVHRKAHRGTGLGAQASGTSGFLAILGQTKVSRHRALAAMRIASDGKLKPRRVEGGKFIGYALALSLNAGESRTVDRIVVCDTEKKPGITAERVWSRGLALAQTLGNQSYDLARDRHTAYWADYWKTRDIIVGGSPGDQQGMRYCIFQLNQTYHGADARNNISAKGLTGEAYGGRAWWDTETYCLPFYLFTTPHAAHNLLEYRYRTLPQARALARELDCRGAKYPLATIDGTESCPAWQHTCLEIHVSAAVAYGIWHYLRVTGDKLFLYTKGLEMLLEICRYYASRGQWSPSGDFGFWFVMGPDEFHMGVNNNCYTNYMVKRCIGYTLQFMQTMKTEAPSLLNAVIKKIKLTEAEVNDWKKMARKMRIVQDSRSGVFEQHDGYFDTPHLDCSAIAPEDIPLYNHWSYCRLYRWVMTKQPDVLLLQFLHNQDFSAACKRANYNYYEPRCIHESSLSPSIHSILAAELGEQQKAADYWSYAARLDLDDYNRNTREGLHTTSMAAAWMNMVYGFGGMRTDGPRLSFQPALPKHWSSLCFKISYQGSLVEVTLERKRSHFRIISGNPVQIDILGTQRTVTAQGITVN